MELFWNTFSNVSALAKMSTATFSTQFHSGIVLAVLALNSPLSFNAQISNVSKQLFPSDHCKFHTEQSKRPGQACTQQSTVQKSWSVWLYCSSSCIDFCGSALSGPPCRISPCTLQTPIHPDLCSKYLHNGLQIHTGHRRTGHMDSLGVLRVKHKHTYGQLCSVHLKSWDEKLPYASFS